MSTERFPGELLKERREELGLGMGKAFRDTRIPMRYLEAMEQGAVERLPAPCYAVGFIRTYCTFLGLAPERFCDYFLASTAPPAKRFLRRRGTARPPWVAEWLTWAAVCGVLALAWVTYSAVVRPNADPSESRVKADTKMVVPAPPADLDE